MSGAVRGAGGQWQGEASKVALRHSCTCYLFLESTTHSDRQTSGSYLSDTGAAGKDGQHGTAGAKGVQGDQGG